MEHGVLELVEMLYNMVSEAWGVPLGNEKCIIERDKVLNLLEEIRPSFPWSWRRQKAGLAKEEFINSAKREAGVYPQGRRGTGAASGGRAGSRAHCKGRSNELLTTAEQKSKELRRVANEYVDDALRRTEEAVAAALDEIRQSRIRFRNVAGVQQNQQIRQISEADLEE